MDVDETLPESEAALLTTLLKLPYHKRTGYGLKLVNSHRDNPALLSLIRELLSTTLLPDTVPFLGNEKDSGYITLLFPQSTASKRFFQRELGLAMASALGQSGVPFLLDAIIHPSTAGKSLAITACASPSSGATDKQLVETYQKSIPATQESLQAAMVAAGRIEALKILHLWQEPPPAKTIDPRCITLERDLENALPRDRDEVWTRAGLSLFRLHRHLHNPLFIPKDSKADLITTIFELLERYPPPHLSYRFNDSQVVPSIPSSLDKRIHSFLLYNLVRTLQLVRRTCYIPDPENKKRDRLRLPSSFMHHKSSSRFWHMLSIQEQTNHLLPFIVELMQMQNQVLLKNGQLRSADLLRHARWQIVVAVAENALTCLESGRMVKALSVSEIDGIIDFVVHAIDMLSSRLHAIAHREEAHPSQTLVEEALQRVIVCSVQHVLAACRVSASSDDAFVKSFMRRFVLPVLRGPLKQYPPLVEVLFHNMKGIFDIAQVSKSELVSTACQFLQALKRRKLSVFDIPNNGVVQPYCGIGETDNDAVFQLLLRLEHPRDNPSFYVKSVINELLERQREVLWSYFNDPEYVCAQLLNDVSFGNLPLFVQILTELPASPRARLPIVKAVLDHPKMDDSILAEFYPLLDISDQPSREILQKNTYKRLFTDRYRAYRHLMMATWSHEPREYITTMRFLIPRIRNEIVLDAQLITKILEKNGVGDLLPVWDRATDDEAKELAQLYLTWEKQNNEAVSRVSSISEYILSLANLALSHYAGSPDHPFFHFGMDLLWAREVFVRGPLKAHETYSIHISMTEPKLTEDEELKRRQFILDSKDSLGEMGYWKISDERQFVDTLLEQYHKVHQTTPFERSAAYPGFVSDMHKLLGVRWTIVPMLREYTDGQLDVLRSIAGSARRIADWKPETQRVAVNYILRLRTLYHAEKVTSESLPWWSEFRQLRLFSTDASVEVTLLHGETFDSKGKQNPQQLDKLVEQLLGIDDSAVHLGFVRLHLMENRQDLLKDIHITGTLVGLFNQLPSDAVAQPPPWEFTFPRRFYPHQCELFAVKLLETIHSGEVPLHSQVKAAEDLTKLPTTTIIELAELLKEDLNQRVIEAILMFLPHLDEPASGIQFLLAPSYLDGELARTVVFSVRKCLQHVPAGSLPNILIPVFPPENSKRFLKITVMKELVRLVCQHASSEDLQIFLMQLWRRKLHQDVRIAFLQSVISFLGSKQESLACAILRDAVSNPSLVLNDALFALLAVKPSKSPQDESGVHVAYLSNPEILTDMAENTIPKQCHDMYTEDVLYPLSQLWSVISVSSLNVNEKETKLTRERLHLLRQSAYNTIFSHFLTPRNAHAFAQRGLDAAKGVALSDGQDVDLFPYFVYGIGKCVALDPRCWDVLCQLIDFLAGSTEREPTRASLKAVQRLQAMCLGTNMTFQSPESIRNQLTVDRMSLLEPLARHGCDHFAVTFWERRFHLFSYARQRALSQNPHGNLPSELNETRSLLLELIRLSAELQYTLTELKRNVAKLLNTTSAPIADALVEILLSGSHGLDFIWINELRLEVLTQRVRKTVNYARSLTAFQTLVSNYHSSFYAQHWEEINKLIVSILKPDSVRKSVPKELVSILLDPIFDRAESSGLDSHILHSLLDALPDVILCYRPQWAIEQISAMLFSMRPWETNASASRSALLLIEFVNTTSIQGNSTVALKTSDVSPVTALLVEAIYSGNLRNFDLGRVISSSAQKPEPVLSYPFFVTNQDDGSGGDIEDRRSKATVPQLLDRYQEWKSTHASQYLSGIHQPQIPPSMLAILHQVLGRFPQLVLVHPSLFLSYAASTFCRPDLDTQERIGNVFSHLMSALAPNRRGESGTRWGWVPPLSLALSFARILFAETANEILEAALDDYVGVASITCKLAALELLVWWRIRFTDVDTRQSQLMKAMEQGEGREDLMRQFDELTVLACHDESRIVREKAFTVTTTFGVSS